MIIVEAGIYRENSGKFRVSVLVWGSSRDWSPDCAVDTFDEAKELLKGNKFAGPEDIEAIDAMVLDEDIREEPAATELIFLHGQVCSIYLVT